MSKGVNISLVFGFLHHMTAHTETCHSHTQGLCVLNKIILSRDLNIIIFIMY